MSNSFAVFHCYSQPMSLAQSVCYRHKRQTLTESCWMAPDQVSVYNEIWVTRSDDPTELSPTLPLPSTLGRFLASFSSFNFSSLPICCLVQSQSSHVPHLQPQQAAVFRKKTSDKPTVYYLSSTKRQTKLADTWQTWWSI